MQISNQTIQEKINMSIDTVKFKVPGIKIHLSDTTHSMVTTSDGIIISNTSNRKHLSGRLPVHSVAVRSDQLNNTLQIEGALHGFLYGQNICTLKSMRKLCLRTLQEVRKQVPFELDDETRRRILAGDIELLLVHIAMNFSFETLEQAQKILQQIKLQFASQHAKTSTNMSSAQWAARSGSGYTIVFYDKFSHMRTKRTDDDELKKLVEECRGVIRVELRLTRRELKKLGLLYVRDWTLNKPKEIFDKYFARVPLFNATSGGSLEKELDALPKKLRRAYALHKNGSDLKDHFSKSYLKKIYTEFRKRGYDLRCPYQTEPAILLKDLFSENRKMANPKWLKKTPLWPQKEAKAKK